MALYTAAAYAPLALIVASALAAIVFAAVVADLMTGVFV